MPIDDATLGRIWNMIGDPIDDKPRRPRRGALVDHRDPRSSGNLAERRDLETGLKVVDLIART